MTSFSVDERVQHVLEVSEGVLNCLAAARRMHLQNVRIALRRCFHICPDDQTLEMTTLCCATLMPIGDGSDGRRSHHELRCMSVCVDNRSESKLRSYKSDWRSMASMHKAYQPPQSFYRIVSLFYRHPPPPSVLVGGESGACAGIAVVACESNASRLDVADSGGGLA